MDQPLWTPSAERIRQSHLVAFTDFVSQRYKRTFIDYADLHAWSCEQREQFWLCVWDFCQTKGSIGGLSHLQNRDQMPGARWFPQAQLNFAENLLRQRGPEDAIVFWGEDKVKTRLSWDDLQAGVSRLAQALRQMGVKKDDRVAAYQPNMPE
ncbi:MAG: AMP-binding protein, partial [Betaproteobacteria bacterium]